MSICGRCGAAFGCAMADPGAAEPCWCTALPPVVALPAAPGGACWCPDCLRRHIAAQTAPAPAAE
ncbi:cysteine-rich CWC family protein [Janthinobacterium fluminis]|uniref:Cysteine-rich CWC family protein n=1 Tax=Janthinobacterium fluminis TaxID=2987524 RepID=A0ABT5JYG7_9BURK|nr:cysteine-rich CWC family protein [Janthinobacterium fluminis]MDC8757775.1 cysteine-rich CWC family protein [Janthinobacterium fluminis]